jgi:hypothetical protein
MTKQVKWLKHEELSDLIEKGHITLQKEIVVEKIHIPIIETLIPYFGCFKRAKREAEGFAKANDYDFIIGGGASTFYQFPVSIIVSYNFYKRREDL